MNSDNAQVNPSSCPRLNRLVFAEGLDAGFDIEAYVFGYGDCYYGRPYNDRAMPPYKGPILVPPFVPNDRPLSWKESYRLGWFYASQSRN
jgi:hypothetical protein